MWLTIIVLTLGKWHQSPSSPVLRSIPQDRSKRQWSWMAPDPASSADCRQHETPLPAAPRPTAFRTGGDRRGADGDCRGRRGVRAHQRSPGLSPTPALDGGRAAGLLHVAILLQWCGPPRAWLCARSRHAAAAGSRSAGGHGARRLSPQLRPWQGRLLTLRAFRRCALSDKLPIATPSRLLR